MGRIAKPAEIQRPSDNIDDLVTKIVKGEVVLVLGREHMLNEDLSGGDVIAQVTSDFFDYKRQKDPNFKSSYDSFNDYYYQGAELQKMKIEIAESLDDSHYSFEKEDYSPKIYQLLQKKCFPVVLTTTFDYYVENIMREIYGDQLRVLNIFDQANDIDEVDAWQNNIQPTLYYVFGRAEKEKNYTVVEKDAMTVIEKWLSDPPKNFSRYLSGKSILALGTKFDDWLFRFFWYSLRRNLNELKKGQVAISLNQESETDSKLGRFLEGERIQNGSINQIVDSILDTYDLKEKEYRIKNGSDTDVFISYSSSSFDTVKHLFYALKKEGFKVWFDKTDINSGADHEQVIINAINNCKIFLPVITKAVKACVNDKRDDFHYFRDVEWATAMSRVALQEDSLPLVVMPFCMEGLTIKDISFDESQKDYEDFIMKKSCGDNRTEAGFKSFVGDMKKNLV